MRNDHRPLDIAMNAASQTGQLAFGAVPVTITAAADGAESALPRFSMTAYTGAPVRLAYWRHPVVVDLSGMSIPRQSIPIRFNHDPALGVGHTTSVKVEKGALVAEGVISRDTPESRDVVSSARHGFPWQASIGASADETSFVEPGTSVVVNGRTVHGPVNVVRRATLGEISFVDLGADGATSATVAASAQGAAMGFEDWVRAKGFDPATLTDGQRGALMQAWQAETSGTRSTGAGQGGEPTAAEVIARARAERERQSGIRALVEQFASQRNAPIEEIERIAARADAEGLSLKDTELELLRCTRPRPQPAARASRPTQPVLEAALAMACGVSDERLAADRDYGDQVVTAAWSMRQKGLRGILAEALLAAGIHVPYGGREFFDALISHQRIQAAGGYSNVDLPGLLGNVANKILLEAFTGQPGTYALVAQQEDFSNFHAHTLYRLDHLGDFAQVPPTGELKHGSLSESDYSNQLKTYGQVLSLSRQAIINDELSAFVSLPRLLARKAKTAIERAFYGVVMESSDSFYTTARGNKATSSALSITTLGTARAMLAKMNDAGGDPLGTEGKYLLVPTELEPLAMSIYTDATVNETTTTDKAKPVGNPHRNRYQPVSSPYLSAASMTGYSATTWYLLADPNILPAFQVAYLDGRRQPTIETADAEFTTLGLQMRAYWDFGVSRVDYRGAVKMVG